MTNGQNVNERMLQLSNAVKAHADVTDAVNELVAIAEGQRTEMKLLREERDSARREVCYCHPASAQFAINRGWNCFDEETT